jgi:hypothetical protein
MSQNSSGGCLVKQECIWSSIGVDLTHMLVRGLEIIGMSLEEINQNWCRKIWLIHFFVLNLHQQNNQYENHNSNQTFT